MKKSGMTLVVGGSGFIGQSLCKKLAKSNVGLINFSVGDTKVEAQENINGDITDQDAIKMLFNDFNIDKVINFASLLASNSTNDPISAIRVGVEGNTNLFEMCNKFNVKRYVFASSTCLLRPNLVNPLAPVCEDAEVVSESVYEEIKRFVESIGAKVSSTLGFEFISARISLVIGPGQPSKTSAYRTEMFNLLKSGGKIKFPFKEDVILPISHYEDVANSLYKLLTSPNLQHAVYNIPCESWRVSDIAELVSTIGNEITYTFGDQLFTNGAPYIDWKRIKNELGAEIVPLEKRLFEYKRRIK